MRLINKRIYSSLFFIFCLLSSIFADNKAQDLLEKTKATFNSPYPIVASFTFVEGDKSSNTEFHTHGSLTSLDNKFILELPDSKSWYNGSTLWTYIKGADEVNISTPSKEEALAMNPTKLIDLYMKSFKCSYLGIDNSGNMKKTHHIRMDNTKKVGTPIESIDIWIDEKDFSLKRINISTNDNKNQEIILPEFKIDKSISVDIFNFDSKLFPTAEIFDLR